MARPGYPLQSMRMQLGWGLLGLTLGLVNVAPAQAALVEDFETTILGSGTLFNTPRYSGSTRSFIRPTPDVGRVIGMPTPRSPLWPTSRQVCEVQWDFYWDNRARWLRLTTFNTPRRPNPIININRPLTFSIYTTAPVRLAIGIRETSIFGPIGSNGGSTGAIEWVSNSGLRTDGQSVDPGGVLLTAGQWQTVTIDLPSIPRNQIAAGQVAVFAGGDGRLNGPGGYTLEHFAFTGVPGHLGVQVFIDDITQPAVSAQNSPSLIDLLAKIR